jgi:hypothetical protein
MNNCNIVGVNLLGAVSISTNYGFFSTISAGFVFGQFVGDGSRLTGISGGGGASAVPPFLSTQTLSTNLLTASNISTDSISTNHLYGLQGFISSLQVDALQIGATNGYIYIPDLLTSTISSVLVYGQFIGDGSRLTGLQTGWVSTATSYLNMNNYTISNVGNPLYLAGSNGIQISNTNGGGVASLGVSVYNNLVVASPYLDMGENSICNCAQVQADFFYGNGANLTNIPSVWVGTATSDLDMAGYYISNSVSVPQSIYGWGGIQIIDTSLGGCNTLSVDATNYIATINGGFNMCNYNVCNVAGVYTASNTTQPLILSGYGGVKIMDAGSSGYNILAVDTTNYIATTSGGFNICNYDICNVSNVNSCNFNGSLLCNASGILNLAGLGGIKLSDTATNCNVQVTFNDNFDLKITAPTSNLVLQLGPYTGTLSTDGSNLYWNNGLVGVTY